MARRRARDRIGTCQLCLSEGPLSFEHVPPQAALNDQRMETGTITHWLQRDSSRTDAAPHDPAGRVRLPLPL